jgi:hypothetical protein
VLDLIDLPPLYNLQNAPPLVFEVKRILVKAMVKRLAQHDHSFLELDCGQQDFALWNSDDFKSILIVNHSAISNASISLSLMTEKMNNNKSSSIKCRTSNFASPDLDLGGFDIIASVFSVQRHFKSEQAAKQFFVNLRRTLNIGGYFICLFQSGSELVRQKEDADSIAKHINQEVFGDHEHTNKRVKHEVFGSHLYPTQLNPIDHNNNNNKQITLKMIREVNDGKVTQNEEDYLVFCNAMESLAREFGFTPLKQWPSALDSYIVKREKSVKQIRNVSSCVALILEAPK